LTVGFLDDDGVFPASDHGDIVWFYRMHGYVVVRGLVREDELRRVKQDCLDLQRRAAAGELSDRHMPESMRHQPDTLPNYVDHVSELSEAVRSVAEGPTLQAIMRSLLGDGCWPGYLGGRQVKYQDARPGTDSQYSRIGWHSDWQAAPSLPIFPKVAFTLHLDATSPYNGFLRVLPGSHLWATPAQSKVPSDGRVSDLPELVGGYTKAPPPFPMPSGFEKLRGEVGVYAAEGDVILHDGYVWHAAARATDDNARRRHVRGSYYTGEIPGPGEVTRSIKTAAR
jgi:ectoine hydroxylase-related dioxygenase (phytanoyl-CoA dioxygenase family)